MGLAEIEAGLEYLKAGIKAGDLALEDLVCLMSRVKAHEQCQARFGGARVVGSHVAEKGG